MNIKSHLTKKDTLSDGLSVQLDEIEVILSEEPDLKPDFSLDKQILTAAYRETLDNKKREYLPKSVWKRLSLPLYISSGFVFTVLAYNSLLLEPLKIRENKDESSTIVKIETDDEIGHEQYKAQQHEKRELPIMESPEPVPDRVLTETNPVESSHNSALESGSELIQQGIYTGSEISKTDRPEKEAWARIIIGHFRNGQVEEARSELIRFKDAYPDYPIEEQIKVFNH